MAKILKIVNCEQCDNYGIYYCVREHKDIKPEHIEKCIIPDWCSLPNAPLTKQSSGRDGAPVLENVDYNLEYVDAYTVRFTRR